MNYYKTSVLLVPTAIALATSFGCSSGGKESADQGTGGADTDGTGGARTGGTGGTENEGGTGGGGGLGGGGQNNRGGGEGGAKGRECVDGDKTYPDGSIIRRGCGSCSCHDGVVEYCTGLCL